MPRDLKLYYIFFFNLRIIYSDIRHNVLGHKHTCKTRSGPKTLQITNDYDFFTNLAVEFLRLYIEKMGVFDSMDREK